MLMSARKYRGFAIKVLVALWIFALYSWSKSIWIFSSPMVLINPSKLDQIVTARYPRHEQLQKYEIKSDVYQKATSDILLLNIFKKLDFDQRCELYFTELFNLESSWFVDPHRHFDYHREQHASLEEYKEEQIKQVKEKQVKETDKEEPIDPKVIEEITKTYHSNWNRIKYEEQVLHNFISHAKIFNKCFLGDEKENEMFALKQRKTFKHFVIGDSHPPEDFKLVKYTCRTLESRVYPWLTGELPKFQHWDGKEHSFPMYKKVRRSKETHDCFLTDYKKKLNGEGIVLTISDDHLESTIRLIRLLRALGNTLPIQIIYFKNLSDESKFQLVAACTVEFDGYPMQDLWFVDVSRSIKDEYKGKFEGFGNKILATLFNSFEQMILMDADTVVLKPPEFFFTLPKYVANGTMFYKDRYAVEYRPMHDVTFFKKLMPSIEDTFFFGFDQITDYTLLRELLKGSNHYMESGLVVINKKRHFNMPLMMAEMNFYLPVQARVYGDKELFWLAMVLSGVESYSFNDHFSAAIGAVTPSHERLDDPEKAKKLQSMEVCSNHPGHVNDVDSHSLLWFNSGFRHCGKIEKVNIKEEFESKKRYTNLKTLESFKTFFESVLIIKNAVVPPADLIVAPNNEGESDKSWINLRDYCWGYTWCGYSQIGAESYDEATGNLNSNIAKGIFIEYSEDETREFSRLGDIWMSPFDFRSVSQVTKDEATAAKVSAEQSKRRESKLRS